LGGGVVQVELGFPREEPGEAGAAFEGVAFDGGDEASGLGGGEDGDFAATRPLFASAGFDVDVEGAVIRGFYRAAYREAGATSRDRAGSLVNHDAVVGRAGGARHLGEGELDLGGDEPAVSFRLEDFA